MNSDGKKSSANIIGPVPDKPEHVHIGMFDADASFRTKKVSGEKGAKLARNGGLFCDVLYNWDTAEQPQGSGAFIDRPTKIDTNSWRAYPFAENEAICIADFTPPFGERSPRIQALKMIERAKTAGFSTHAAFEFEFMVLNETPDSLRTKDYTDFEHFSPGNRTYSLLTQSMHHGLLATFEDTMARLGISLDALHTELGPGCFEAPLAHAQGIKAADDAALFKNFTKAFFLRNNLMATFMAKLDPGFSGQSGHLHLSLRSLTDGSPVFSDTTKPDGLSQTARHFIGGIVTLMPEMLALCSHTINAYKRLVPGAWAPTHASWGVQNRTAALRVINDDPDSCRLEFRVPAADTNPYSALAMLIGAGMWGIENEIDPPAPSDSDCYAMEPTPSQCFPSTLSEAAQRLAASTVARELFGDCFIDTFVAMRGYEVEGYQAQVTPWEVRRYIEVV
ncbi:glutamine synthetase family protein [Roseovarius pacificus]|uniref:glutamine synthetase family protein n=1 Tax=Roseovarius pacificus TaxID=337701 RepID=UPI004039C8F0